jgi:hypothetical protein
LSGATTITLLERVRVISNKSGLSKDKIYILIYQVLINQWKRK